MADIAVSGLGALGGAPATNDLLVLVDVSDHTQAPTGTTKNMTIANLFTSPHLTGAVVDSGGLTVTAGGLTVSAGATAVQALTATTGSFTSTLTVQGAANSLQWHSGGFEDWFMNIPAASTSLIMSNSTNGTCFTLTNAGALTLRAGLTATTAAISGNASVGGTLGVTGAITATGGVVGALTGNASTATALATPRTINGTSFDGTANIIVTAAAGTLTGTTLNSSVVTSSLTSVGTLTSVTTSGAVTTGNPTTGTAAPWKLGSRISAPGAFAFSTTFYVELDIGGTLVKLATVT